MPAPWPHHLQTWQLYMTSPACPRPTLHTASSAMQILYHHDTSSFAAHLSCYPQPAWMVNAAIQANGHAPPPPDLAAAQEFPSLGAAPAPARGGAHRAASPASALTPGGKASAWSNKGGAAAILAQQSLTSLGTPLLGALWLLSLACPRL